MNSVFIRKIIVFFGLLIMLYSIVPLIIVGYEDYGVIMFVVGFLMLLTAGVHRLIFVYFGEEFI